MASTQETEAKKMKQLMVWRRSIDEFIDDESEEDRIVLSEAAKMKYQVPDRPGCFYDPVIRPTVDCHRYYASQIYRAASCEDITSRTVPNRSECHYDLSKAKKKHNLSMIKYRDGGETMLNDDDFYVMDLVGGAASTLSHWEYKHESELSSGLEPAIAEKLIVIDWKRILTLPAKDEVIYDEDDKVDDKMKKKSKGKPADECCDNEIEDDDASGACVEKRPRFELFIEDDYEASPLNADNLMTAVGDCPIMSRWTPIDRNIHGLGDWSECKPSIEWDKEYLLKALEALDGAIDEDEDEDVEEIF